MPAQREYGARLKSYREARRVQAQVLAAALGKSRSWVSGVEAGEIRLFYETTVAIARFFDTTPDAILLVAEAPPQQASAS